MNWINFFGKENILKWSSLYFLFFRNPKEFFRRFYKFEEEEKALIFFFYLILVMIFHTFTRGLDVKEISLYFVFSLFLLLQIALLLYITNCILRRKFKAEKITFKDIFYLVALTNIITNPIFEYFNYLFINSEHYIYTILNSVFLLAAVYFILIYSNWIFYKKLKIIVLGVIINIIFINVFIIVRNVNIISSHNTKPTSAGDLVIYNRSEEMILENSVLLEKFPVDGHIPTDKILMLNRESGKAMIVHSYGLHSINSFFSNLPTHIEYDLEIREEIKIKIKQLKNVRKLKYKHNRVLKNEILKIYELADQEINRFEKDSVIPILDNKNFQPYNYLGYEVNRVGLNQEILKQENRIIKTQTKFYKMVNLHKDILSFFGILIYPGIEISKIIDPEDEV